MSLGFVKFGQRLDDGPEPLGQRKDDLQFKRGAAELQHRRQDVHEDRAESNELAGGHSEFFPAKLSLPLEIGVEPKQDSGSKDGKDLVEDLDAVGNLSRFVSDTFLLGELSGPFAKRPVFGSGDAELVDAVDELENQSGDIAANVK